MLFMSCVCYAFVSVHCYLVVTCWARADVLALVCDLNCIFVTFPSGILGQVWYLIVSTSDKQTKAKGNGMYLYLKQGLDHRLEPRSAGRDHLAKILPSASPRSAGLLAEICWKKVKVPAIPRG